jgi:hypothetical protein
MPGMGDYLALRRSYDRLIGEVEALLDSMWRYDDRLIEADAADVREVLQAIEELLRRVDAKVRQRYERDPLLVHALEVVDELALANPNRAYEASQALRDCVREKRVLMVRRRVGQMAGSESAADERAQAEEWLVSLLTLAALPAQEAVGQVEKTAGLDRAVVQQAMLGAIHMGVLAMDTSFVLSLAEK